MNILRMLPAAILSALTAFCFPAKGDSILIDDHWTFHRGGAQRAEQPEFNDASWRIVDLPHDWSIEDLPGSTSPFDRDAISQVGGGFTTGGTGWYRKKMYVSDSLSGKTLYLRFDGVYMNAECWINGQYLGKHPYGYTSFYYDISPYIHAGAENVIAVKVNNEGENSRWYSGSGIYRHVWLTVKDPVHIAMWGTSVSTSDSASVSRISIASDILNKDSVESHIQIVSRIFNNRDKEVGETESTGLVAAGSNSHISQMMRLANANHWSPDNPALYYVVTEIYKDGKLADKVKTPFGIRTLHFDATHGFLLNGVPLKLKGGCFHHDNGPLGSKSFDRAEERKVELLKASGYNAIRCSHNPPSPAFLDACDRLGMLVIDEAFDMWNEGKNPYDYHLYFAEWWPKDLESMVRRDRNHPCIILWSIGNEIPDRQTPGVVAISKMLGDYIRQLDTTRLITAAVNDLRPAEDPYFATLDVAGYNYAAGGDHLKQSLYVEDHERMPDRIMMGTESYPLEAFQSWMDVLDNPWVIGDFVWTAFDYMGEASIGWRGYWQEQNFFPWNLAWCGDLDICGWKRPQSFYRDVLWKTDQISIFVKPPTPSFAPNPARQSWSKWHWLDEVADWNWTGREGAPMEVNVYSSDEKVELLLNGKSLGTKSVNRESKFTATWQVPFEPGVLKAVSYKGKKAGAAVELKTAREPVKIVLTADRKEIMADGQDLCYITVELTDENGIRNPRAEDLVNFEINGPATIIGIGNANPVSLESYVQPYRMTWQGRCLVILRTSHKAGKIELTATANSLPPAKIEIIAR